MRTPLDLFKRVNLGPHGDPTPGPIQTSIATSRGASPTPAPICSVGIPSTTDLLASRWLAFLVAFPLETPSPWSNFLHSHAVFGGKINQIKGCPLPSGKNWIRHCVGSRGGWSKGGGDMSPLLALFSGRTCLKSELRATAQGKMGNYLVLNFSREGKHREIFCL